MTQLSPAESLQFVSRGDAITASGQNSIVEAVKANAQSTNANGPLRSRGLVTLECKNTSGEDFEIGEAVAWKELLTVTDADDFNPRDNVGLAVYEAERLTWHDNLGSLAVVIDDTPDQDIATVAIGGLCTVRLSDPADGVFAFPDPADPKHWRLTDYAGFRVTRRVNDDWAIIDTGWESPFWMYEITQAGADRKAKLLHYDLTDFSATVVDLSDPLSAGIDDAVGYRSWCRHIGNRFVMLDSPCAG
ncbi:MAG: hypothetical protein AAF802_01855 [Planctomycetota bacterium]